MKRIICSLLFFSLLLGGCKKDFLVVEDRSVIALQDYVKDLNTTGEFVNGVQANLTALYRHYNCIYPDLIADNIKTTNPAVALSAHYNWQQIADEQSGFSPGSLNANGTAYDAYRVITSANYALEKIEEFKNEDPAKASMLRGRVLFMRALCHFFIVHVYAQAYNFTPQASHPGIAYVTSSDRFAAATRLTVKEVYDRVIADLTEAMQLIPGDITNALQINRNAVKAILARVYLFKEDFASAKALARDVCQAVPLMTANYPQRLYTTQETEALFQLPPGRSVSIGNTLSTAFPGVFFRSPTIQFYATNDIANLLRERANDARRVWVTGPTSGNWAITKFPSAVVADVSNPAQSYYLSVVRSSEMYLTAAEAYARLNVEDSAWFFLDAIRKRADPTAPTSTASGTALLDSIYKERRKELAFEGLRMYDLLRWKKGVTRIDAISLSAQNLPYPSNNAISPLSKIDVALWAMSQNPGY